MATADSERDPRTASIPPLPDLLALADPLAEHAEDRDGAEDQDPEPTDPREEVGGAIRSQSGTWRPPPVSGHAVVPVRSLAMLLLLCVPALGLAQPDDPARELLPEGMPDDPIGTGDTHTLRDVPTEPEPPPIDPLQPPRTPDIDVDDGAVVSAIPGVREVDHRVDLALTAGRLEASVAMRFISRAQHRAEVRYRLAVPAGTRAGALEVCLENRCRSASSGRASTYDDAVRARPADLAAPLLPVADVHAVEDERGTALIVRAAPVIEGQTLEVRLRYVAETQTHGGITHVELPARGRDPRAAPAHLTFETDELLAPAVDGRPAHDRASGHHEIEPWEPTTLSATHRSGGGAQVDLERFRCGEESCARLHAVAGPRGPRRERVVLLLDASPSMLGPARGRMGAALAALLGTMHRDTEVRALAFAGLARSLMEQWRTPDEVPLATLGRASALELGAATRFEAAWRRLQPRRGDHLIVVGDGGLTESRDGLAAAEAARDAGVRVSVLNLADRETKAALRQLVERTGGLVVQAGAEAQASRSRTTARLEEKVAALSAPTVTRNVRVIRPGAEPVELGTLRAGEALRWSGPTPRGTRFIVGSAQRARRGPAADSMLGRALASMARDTEGALAAVVGADRGRPSLCEDSGPATRAGGVSSDEAPVVLAEARTCAPGPPTAVTDPPNQLGRGVPAETVLSMLRRRVIPGARRCFRVDRAGRGDYSVRAVFELELADREVSGAEVEGEISERLRSCLMATLEGLEVPAFRGSVLVRYPLYTERQPPPPTVQLRDDVAAPVDRLLGEERGRPIADPPL